MLLSAAVESLGSLKLWLGVGGSGLVGGVMCRKKKQKLQEDSDEGERGAPAALQAPAHSNIGAAAIHSVCHIPQTGAMVQLASLRPLDSNQQPSSLRPSARRGGRRRRRRASGAG